jgi:pimeloyl-ACP methyl ester carboxylesterase
MLSCVFVEVDGLRVNVERAGSGPTLLLLHGWGGSIRSFAPLMPAFTQVFSVCAFDLPGFGLSALPPSTWGVSDYVMFVRHLMQRLEIDRAHLLGHSHGGRVGIALAAEAPDAVDRLVLVDAAGIRPPRTLTLRARGLLARNARRLLSHPMAGAPGRRALSALYHRLGMADYASAGPLRATFVRVVNEDLRPLLPAISAPTLVIWGEQDRDTPLWMGRLMAREIPDAELVVLSPAGHYAYLDQPQAFAERVLAFLSGVPA